MVTEELIAEIIADEVQGLGIKLLVDATVATADALTNGLVAGGHALAVEFAKTPTQHLQEAWAADTDRLLGLMTDAATEVARVCLGRNLTSEHAMKALIAMAREPKTQRRLRTLWAEAATSNDERVAMLAVGYFVQGASTTMQERFDAAIRNIFPEDADVLAWLVELEGTPDTHVVVYQFTNTPEGYGELRLADEAGNSGATPREAKAIKVSLSAIHALGAAQCIEIKNGAAGFLGGAIRARDGGVREAHSVRVLGLGRHLHASLTKVDWRTIAATRTKQPRSY